MKENRNIERGARMKVVFNETKKMQIIKLETELAILKTKLAFTEKLICKCEK